MFQLDFTVTVASIVFYFLAEYARNVNYILSYIGDFQHQVNYLHELITFTGPRGVCQVRGYAFHSYTTLLTLICSHLALEQEIVVRY